LKDKEANLKPAKWIANRPRVLLTIACVSVVAAEPGPTATPSEVHVFIAPSNVAQSVLCGAEHAAASMFASIGVRIGSPKLEQALLAHVMVHEVTQVLQGVNRHSDVGVMKAHWEQKEYNQMQWKPLPFTPHDVALVKAGLRAP
jgi:hypothetical protein